MKHINASMVIHFWFNINWECFLVVHECWLLSKFWQLFKYVILIFFSFFKIIYLFFREEERREKERERNINEWLPLIHPLLRTWPTTQACALTRNRTGNPLVLRPAFNPLSYTSQSCNVNLKFKDWAKRKKDLWTQTTVWRLLGGGEYKGAKW